MVCNTKSFVVLRFNVIKSNHNFGWLRFDWCGCLSFSWFPQQWFRNCIGNFWSHQLGVKNFSNHDIFVISEPNNWPLGLFTQIQVSFIIQSTLLLKNANAINNKLCSWYQIDEWCISHMSKCSKKVSLSIRSKNHLVLFLLGFTSRFLIWISSSSYNTVLAWKTN